MHSKLRKFEFRGYPTAKVAKVANFEAGENQLSQVSQGEVSEIIFFAPVEKLLQDGVPCSECPWCQENPWAHYPEFPLWCSWHFDYLEADSQQCIEWRKGEIPHPDRMRSPRGDFTLGNDEGRANAKGNLPHQQVVCSQCHHFKPNDGPNPRQGWGRCEKRRRGRFGVATACEAILTSADGPGKAKETQP